MMEYPCPECGFDGPHPIVESYDDKTVLECDSCYREIEVPT